MKFSTSVLVALCALLSVTGAAAQQKAEAPANDGWKSSGNLVSATLQAESDERCTDGLAGVFPCLNVDLMAFMPIDSIGGRRIDNNLVTSMNDIWGWTDPETGREYALVGRNDGTSFVDVTDPTRPVFVGDLPSYNSLQSTWRDIKTIGHYAVIVADNIPHGMQIFDLTELRSVSAAPVTFASTARFEGFARAHNIVVDTESEFGYAVGTDICPGLYMMDFSNPLSPAPLGCYMDPDTGRFRAGYTHDAQCVVYRGPDTEYAGRQICFAANESHVLIADVTDKVNPSTVSIAVYPDVEYAHQGWLTEDHRFFLQDDELDESWGEGIKKTRTIIWDVTELDDPQVAKIFHADTESIDHNQYTVGDRAFQANYTSGLRILDISDPTEPALVGFFDTFPAHDSVEFSGAWSNYPFFESGNVVVSSIGEGLFVLRPTGHADVAAEEDELPEGFALLPSYPNPFNPRTTIALVVDQPQRVRVAVFDARGKEVAELYSGFVADPGRMEFSFEADGLSSGVYFVRAFGSSGSHTVAVTLQK